MRSPLWTLSLKPVVASLALRAVAAPSLITVTLRRDEREGVDGNGSGMGDSRN